MNHQANLCHGVFPQILYFICKYTQLLHPRNANLNGGYIPMRFYYLNLLCNKLYSSLPVKGKFSLSLHIGLFKDEFNYIKMCLSLFGFIIPTSTFRVALNFYIFSIHYFSQKSDNLLKALQQICIVLRIKPKILSKACEFLQESGSWLHLQPHVPGQILLTLYQSFSSLKGSNAFLPKGLPTYYFLCPEDFCIFLFIMKYIFIKKNVQITDIGDSHSLQAPR